MRPAAGKAAEWWPASLVAGAAVLAYGNSLGGVFQFDDYRVIVEQPAVHSWAACFADLAHGIRPLLKLTYTLNWTLDPAPFGFHLFNLALHAANSLLIHRLALAVSDTVGSPPVDRRWFALTVALLFAVHPALSEAVSYISGRSAALMTFFYLLSLLAYLAGRARLEAGTDRRGGRLLIYLLSPLAFLLAVAGKETAVTLPLALLLCEWLRPQPFAAGAIWRRQAIHWLLLAGLLLLLVLHPRHGPLLAYSFDLRGPAANLLAQVEGVWYLLSRLVALGGLNIDPDLAVPVGWSWRLVLRAVLLAALLPVAFALRRRAPLVAFGLLWFFLQLLPTNSLVARLDVANERQLYPAAAGIFMLLAAALADLARRTPRPAVALLLIMVVVSGSFTVARNQVYHSEIALWEDTAAKSPAKARVWNNLGYAYFLVGREAEARAAYLAALALQPDHATAHANLARLSMHDGLVKDAVGD